MLMLTTALPTNQKLPCLCLFPCRIRYFIRYAARAFYKKQNFY